MANNNSTKKGAYTQPDVIKPKSKWTKKTTAWLVVILVIVLGILAIIGGNNGWFKTADMINGKAELEDYSVIEVESSSVTVQDSTIQSYLDNIVSANTTTEEVTEGTAEDGDTVVINYSGVLAGETEPFEGGTAESQSLVLGSGSMIDGFESQITGHKIGETFDIQVTFPEDYNNADVAGKDAVFTITINSKTVKHVPELTDELVKEYTAANFDEQINTIEELKDYYRKNLEESYMESAIVNSMKEKTKVIYYNEENLADLTSYNASALAYYASAYGMDAATLAQLYGFNSIEEYAQSEAKNTLGTTMMLDKVAEDKGIEITEDEINTALEKYMENEQFEGTLEEFKAQSGAAFLFLVEKTEVLMPKVVDVLKDNVVIVQSADASGNADVSGNADAAK